MIYLLLWDTTGEIWKTEDHAITIKGISSFEKEHKITISITKVIHTVWLI